LEAVKSQAPEVRESSLKESEEQSSGGISPLVQLHRTKVGKLRTLQEEENRRLELLEERSLQERAEPGGGHRASEYRGWRARVLHARRDHES
jgi:hypothetical protein